MPRSKSNIHLILVGILLLGIFLRLFFFYGMGTSDALVYAETAAHIDQGIDPDSVLTLATRIGLIYPTRFFYDIFGINDVSSVLFVLLTSIGTIILIFLYGKLLFNEKTGTIAAFLFALFPLDIYYATRLLSDIPSAFFVGFGVYLFLQAEIKNKIWHKYVLSGALIGVGYLIRETALLIALFFIGYVIYKKRISKEYFLVPVGVILIFLLEAAVFMSLTGDPLYRHNSSGQYASEAIIRDNFYGRLDFPTGLFHYPYIILTNNLLNLFYISIFFALAYSLWKRKKETYTMMLWFIPVLLYLSFGSVSLSQYIPLRAVDRYLSLVTIPGILILAYILSDKQKLIRKTILPLTLIILSITSIWAVYSRDAGNIISEMRPAYEQIKDLDKTIYSDDRALLAFNYISEYNNKADLQVYPESLANVKDAYIYENKKMIANLLAANDRRTFPAELNNPPEEWTIVAQINEDITIYYAP